MPHFDESQLPDEIPDWQRRQIVKQNMEAESSINEIVALFRDLTVDQLLILSRILHAMAGPTGQLVASHYEAWCDAALQYHHKVCHICGRDHTAELLAGVDPHPPVAPDLLPTIEFDFEDALDPNDPLDRGWPYPEGVEPFWTKQQTAIMREYNLDDVYAMDDNGEYECIGVRCHNCGLQYPSPEDRALKPVDGCHGCHQKSAHG